MRSNICTNMGTRNKPQPVAYRWRRNGDGPWQYAEWTIYAHHDIEDRLRRDWPVEVLYTEEALNANDHG